MDDFTRISKEQIAEVLAYRDRHHLDPDVWQPEKYHLHYQTLRLRLNLEQRGEQISLPGLDDDNGFSNWVDGDGRHWIHW